ncbi:putative chaperone j-domain-containing protein [Erysiphe necator]|uniref:Putative chaperone j-domain-containing protein n=1 Tax=Uncinula necator TaxID=52586 RepID=A0A0B1NYI1_UNCNE|nr:putative chaperone j-domain-containing protein [Erysiphe necator]
MWLPLALIVLLCFLQIVTCEEDYYKLLGVTRDASIKEIKRAYRQLSKKYHPDKNPGDNEAKKKFAKVAEVYEALSDQEMRRIYDDYGHEGVKKQSQGGGRGGYQDPMDLFSRFFGGRGPLGNQQGQRRGPDLEVRIGVALKDFYNGHITEFKIEKQQICDECDGSGSADGKVDICQACGGHGIQIKKHQLAPGIYQQIQVSCDVCRGRGKSIKNKCPVCNGNKVVRKVNTFPLIIEKGAPNGKVIHYENDADESPDYESGDLRVTLFEKEPSLEEDNELKVDGTFFRRKGDNLYWKEVLSLREAWLGSWTRNITHLDGHVVALGRPRGVVVQPGQVEHVTGQGMPKWHENGDSVYHSTDYGDLIVEYTVILPDQMIKGMEKDFWALWEKWRSKNGVDLQKDSGRPEGNVVSEIKDEL